MIAIFFFAIWACEHYLTETEKINTPQLLLVLFLVLNSCIFVRPPGFYTIFANIWQTSIIIGVFVLLLGPGYGFCEKKNSYSFPLTLLLVHFVTDSLSPLLFTFYFYFGNIGLVLGLAFLFLFVWGNEIFESIVVTPPPPIFIIYPTTALIHSWLPLPPPLPPSPSPTLFLLTTTVLTTLQILFTVLKRRLYCMSCLVLLFKAIYMKYIDLDIHAHGASSYYTYFTTDCDI